MWKDFWYFDEAFTRVPILKLMDYGKEDPVLCTNVKEVAIGVIKM
jgi:hypothetical protein